MFCFISQFVLCVFLCVQSVCLRVSVGISVCCVFVLLCLQRVLPLCVFRYVPRVLCGFGSVFMRFGLFRVFCLGFGVYSEWFVCILVRIRRVSCVFCCVFT